VKRKIVAFHRDEESHWVAKLECGHNQHVRHDLPMSERPWVLTEPGRRSRLGIELECVRCDERELPAGHVAYRRTAEFTESTVPRALLSRHTTKPGVWARIHVLDGALLYLLREPFDEEQRLEPGAVGVVLPGVEHEVQPLGYARFFVEFFRAAADE
jgi:tellurite resistance-related uncharacterized protein